MHSQFSTAKFELIIFDLVAIDKKYPENVGVDIISLFNENNDELLTIGKV